jgi:CheY-like chemotaxis protein
MPAVRIVAVTGWGKPEDRKRSREAGFDMHLMKPVELSEIQRALLLNGASPTKH